MRASPEHLRQYLHEAFVKIIHNDDFIEGLYAHLSGGYGGVDATYIKRRLQAVFDIAE